MYPYSTPREPGTTRGLRWCMTAFAVYIIMMIIQLIFGAWLSIALSSVTSTTPNSQITSLLMMMILLTVIAGIVGVLALIFYFVGFGHMYSGRDELGPKHSRNMWISLILAISAMVAYGIGLVSQVFVSMSIFGTNYGSAESVKEYLTRGLIASSISGGIVAALVAAALSLSILALVAPGRKPLVFIAAIMGASTPGIVGTIGLLQISGIVDRLYRSGSLSLDPSIGLPTIVGGILGIVTFAIFLLVFHSVYASIKNGQLRPIVKQPIPIWMPQPYFIPIMPYQPVQPPYAPPQQVQPPTPPRTQP